MFSQKKSIWKRGWFAILIVILLGIGYWINQSTDNLVKPNNFNQEIVNHESLDHTSNNENNMEPSKVTNVDREVNEPERQGPYYLIKEENQVISVYYYNEKGQETFIKNTDISYLLLSEADQALFSEGIVKYTEEELEELLQDFGS